METDQANKINKTIINALSKLTKEELRALQELNAEDIKSMIQSMNQVCSVCGNPNPKYWLTWISDVSGLTLKAQFCELDCLEYFTSRLRYKKQIQSKTLKI